MAKENSALSQSFVDNHKDVSEDVAADLIVKAELKMKAIREEEAADETLAQAKQIAKDLGKAYKDAKKYEKAKIKFLLEKIEEIRNNEVNPTSSLSQ